MQLLVGKVGAARLVTSRRVHAEVFKYELDTRNSQEEPIGRALFSVDGRMELLTTRPWFKSELDTRNSREESNITAIFYFILAF
jgi:hypothetical protein